MTMLTDTFARKIEYVRLSVTDLCNLRCRYCMPLSGAIKQDRMAMLTFEEWVRLLRVFTKLGVRTVRLTGGEPLLRRDIPTLIGLLREIDGLEEILLTTNGYRLPALASQLKAAGLSRINVHLDTLDPNQYRHMTHGGCLDDVLRGIDAAQQAGFDPIKLNTVLLRDYNDDEIEAMTYFAAERGLILRFIELMPVGPGQDMQTQFLSTESVTNTLAAHWTLLPYGKKLGPGPAEYYKIAELGSVIGLIHAVSKPFCNQCNRLRIAADGRIQDCLAYDESVDLRAWLRTPGTSDDQLEDVIRRLIGMKRQDHGGFLLPQYKQTCGMYGIGG